MKYFLKSHILKIHSIYQFYSNSVGIRSEGWGDEESLYKDDRTSLGLEVQVDTTGYGESFSGIERDGQSDESSSDHRGLLQLTLQLAWRGTLHARSKSRNLLCLITQSLFALL